MKHATLMASLVVAILPLLACSQPPAPPAPPALPASPTASNADKGFIGRQVDRALAEARKELHAGNLSINGDIDITVNGKRFGKSDGHLPKAEISPQGELLIEGKTVETTAEQRRQLLTYRNQVLGIADAGIAIGSQGADLAGKALGGVFGVIFGGEQEEKAFEARMEAEGRKIEAEALKLCAQLPPLLASQQALAASLPAFKPYATMTQEDIDDCGKDAKGKGIAVTSN
ncbi:MAG: hypothetical protein ABS98_16715 [Lysobacteraceae bacterium SCN 69-48]|nr:MAG: hypothetical protein ABS98_16715 [Xanthomonadaceae bacterium SCN 69-48]